MNSNKQGPTLTVLPMRFYANWDVDRTSSPIAVQRILSMVFTRLSLTKSIVNTENIPIIIAIRLQSNRRILRSNDLAIQSSKLEIPLDISFTIQYCHFIKRKPNILQILIQRRKRYKNRQIPGFKTLAMGHLNLDEILQFGGSREVIIWDTTMLNKARHSMRELHAGKISIVNCYTQAAESSEPCTASTSRHQRLVTTVNEREPIVLSEEEEFTDDESDSDAEFTPRNETNDPSSFAVQSRRKKILKRNIKQRVVALLRRFKPDEESTSECHHSQHVIVPPTEQELQEIFEELSNISDSGPELEPDKMSISSNPRPKIRPFFGSKSDIMPSIIDYQNEEGLFFSDEIISDDTEAPSSADAEELHFKQEQSTNCGDITRKKSAQSYQRPTNYVRPLLIHSDTVHSILSNEQRAKAVDKIDELFSKLDALSSSQHIIPEHIWICSSTDLPWLSKINSKLLEPIFLFDCPTLGSVKIFLQTIFGRIQNFCNNNSISPSTTIIGVIGGDNLLANILKIYVMLLQDKACKEDWLNYLRFSLVLPPTSAVGRLLCQVAGFGGYSEAIWKVLCRISKAFKENSVAVGINEHNEIKNCLAGLTREQSTQRSTNLQIGEVMLQLAANNGPSLSSRSTENVEGKSQVFVPFLAELLTGTNIINEHTSFCDHPTLPSLYYIKQISTDEQRPINTNEIAHGMSGPFAGQIMDSYVSTNAQPVKGGGPTQHSQSSPSIPTLAEIMKDLGGVDDDSDKINISPPRQGSTKNSPFTPTTGENRELQIEYWTALNYPCTSSNSPAVQQHIHPSQPQQREENSLGGKFSIKASVRTLSIAREPMSNLLSILFVKERKKDKVLQKLGRRSKQKSIDAGTGFCSQSRVVSGVTRIVCTSGTGGIGKKDPVAGMDVFIDGVPWRGVRFFQIGAQWQTHVKLFPVSFPTELPVSIPM